MNGHRPSGSRQADHTTTASNSSIIHHLEMATPGVSPAQDRQVSLKNLVVECSPEDSTKAALCGMTLVILGLSGEDSDSGLMEEITPTSWRYNREIHLHSDIDKLKLVVLSESAGDMGYMVLSEDELLEFMAIGDDVKVERDLVMMKENRPSLKVSFTIGVSHDTAPGVSENISGFSTASGILPRSSILLEDRPELGRLYENPQLLNDFGDRFSERFLESNLEGDINSAVSAYELAVEVTPPNDANYAVYVRDAGLALYRRFKLSGKLPDINKAISMMEIAIACTIEGDVELPAQLNNLGNAYSSRFQFTGHLPDLENAIFSQQRAVALTHEEHTDMPSWLNNLGNTFSTRFKHTGTIEDLACAISSQQRAVALTPEGHPNMPSWLNNLGNTFLTRFKRSGAIADIESAISSQQRAVILTPEGHTAMPSRLNNMGNTFLTRFKYTGAIEDIESAISSHQKAVVLTPEGHTALPSRLNNLGTSFLTRFKLTGDIEDIQGAISNRQKALALTPEGHIDMPSRLNNLGCAFATRFQQTGDIEDLACAISSQRQAVALTPEGHTDMPSLLNALGNTFLTRFQRTGAIEDIESAISSRQRAIALTPDGHTDMPSRLSNLGNAFLTRFKCTGAIEDIESAISSQQKAIVLTFEGHTAMPSRLNNLGNSFLSRFKWTGAIEDIESAIYSQKKAVALTPEGHTDMPYLLNALGNTFLTRFKRTGAIEDIENAISSQQRAIVLTPEGHTAMPSRLDNLGNAFLARFESTGAIEDVQSAVSSQQRAVTLTPDGHPRMPYLFNNLGNAFSTRFECTGANVDIESAISSHQTAVRLTQEGHASSCTYLMNLATSLIIRFESTQNLEDIRQGISMLRLSALQFSGHPSTRLAAARRWARFSCVWDKSQALDAFSVAIRLLPQVCGLEKTIHKRHQALVEISNVTASATAAAIEDAQLKMALAWLEQGRCLVWNQINELRAPADDLRAYNPSLAERFMQLALALEASGSRQERYSTFSEETMMQMVAMQEEAHSHAHRAREWNDLLSEIRAIPQFQDFLQPPQASNLLRRLPQSGPIVTFNIHGDRCDALALISCVDTPHHIPLESFSHKQAIQMCDSLLKYLKQRGVRMREVERGGLKVLPHGKNGFIHQVLHDLWAHVVKPILDALGYSSPTQNRSRIWWCPTGPLAFLPIHAAGIYGKDRTPGSCVSDFVISSYTPTVSALLDKTKGARTMDQTPTRLLLISQPSTPGQSWIPATTEETHAVRDMMAANGVESFLIEGGDATTTRVQEEMKAHNWVHFACHAIQDERESLKSGVHLHDGRLELLEMMRQRIPNTDHAFLSACQTSTGNEKLSDEAVHLAAGMLAAGYQGVVATMWSIMDKYGPEIAAGFYSHLLEGPSGEGGKGRLDVAGAARALDHSTRKIRERLGDTEQALLTWVPYVHFGI